MRAQDTLRQGKEQLDLEDLEPLGWELRARCSGLA
jgi:hypothetical protein